MHNYQKIKIISEEASQKSYTCPASNLSYFGDCNVITCPFNITKTKPGHGGCFHHVGKPSLIDAAVWMGISTGEAKRKYKKALRSIDKFLVFYNWLTNHRFHKQSYFTIKTNCPDCGVPNQGKCINHKKCVKREKLLAKVLAKQPFNVPDISFQKNEFWEIAEAQRRGKVKDILSEKYYERAIRYLASLNLIKLDSK